MKDYVYRAILSRLGDVNETFNILKGGDRIDLGMMFSLAGVSRIRVYK